MAPPLDLTIPAFCQVSCKGLFEKKHLNELEKILYNTRIKINLDPKIFFLVYLMQKYQRCHTITILSKDQSQVGCCFPLLTSHCALVAKIQFLTTYKETEICIFSQEKPRFAVHLGDACVRKEPW